RGSNRSQHPQSSPRSPVFAVSANLSHMAETAETAAPDPEAGMTLDADRARELGRQGGRASAAARQPPPEPGSISILDLLAGWGFTAPSWAAWRVFLKAI